MEFKRYNTFAELANYKQDWHALLSQSASHVPFLTYEYLKIWWETRGGGEWPQDSQLVLVAAFQEDHLVGIAPLFYSKNILGKPALMFIGAIEVSDFLDFIVKPEDLQTFTTGLIDFLLKSDLPLWEVLDLYNLLEESPTLAVLKSEAETRGWKHQEIHLQPSPYIPLPGNFESYLAQIDKKQRHEIRRKMRNVDQSLAKPGLYFTEDEEKLEADVQAFIDMMAQDPNKRDFLSDTMCQHIHNTARLAFEQGWLQLAFFTLDGEKAAANLSFNFNNRLWLYNSGWEWEYRDYSPGWVLLAYLIEWAAENGIREFDFMRGDEPYKYKFGGVDRHVFRVTIERE
ncbi:MAG: GNAT family N-acetyltransferase [Brevefilum sp.]|nr:GNAT family N-acetyltransferase [Brevefilum sp.]MDT8382653.1 GNAT family N-acetyltransferase [Brevefilum sp.]MDW7754018.1 GNAT family N-acetyltransferase [Brevefilum sp.]